MLSSKFTNKATQLDLLSNWSNSFLRIGRTETEKFDGNKTCFAKFLKITNLSNSMLNHCSLPFLQIFAVQCTFDILSNNEAMLKERTNLDKHEIIDLINLCLQAAIFEHNDDVYKQTHGTSMGSPISVVLAELVMQKIEEEIMNNPPCPPLVWKRYIDDVITILPRDNVPTFLNYINSINDNIKFTAESEALFQLPYLDLLLKKLPDGSINFHVYRKPSSPNNYFKFTSNHLMQAKRSVVKSLQDRATNLCSADNVQDEETKIKEILKENGYPRKFLIKQHQSQEPSQPSTSDNLRQRRYVSVPYIKGTYERASRILKKINIKLGSKPSNKLQNQLGNAKQKRNTKDKSNVVYEIDC